MTVKRAVAVGIFIIVILIGGVLWMSGEERTTKSMLRYLEDKYGERFEVEFFDKGDMLFPDLYGDDKMMVHPVGKPDIPFYVFKESNGFSDNYVRSFFSHHYTEKYREDVKQMDSRQVEATFSLASGEWPDEAEEMKRDVEDVVADEDYGINIILNVAIKTDTNKIDMQEESVFLYNLYSYMEQKRNAGTDIILAVAYVHPDKFIEAEKVLRLSYAINFDWDMLGSDAVVRQFYFGTGNDIQGPDYFLKYEN